MLIPTEQTLTPVARKRLAAIREFNDTHAMHKISQIVNLKLSRSRPERWNEQMYAFHDFAHPAYMRNVTPRSFAQLPL